MYGKGTSRRFSPHPDVWDISTLIEVTVFALSRREDTSNEYDHYH
jgi:hypothetical protein